MTASVPVRPKFGPTREARVRACLVGGALASVSAVQAVFASIRATGTANDIVGFAIPLPGDPHDESVALQVQSQMVRRTGIGAWLQQVIDPHRPSLSYTEQVEGRNVPLAHGVLGDQVAWVGAVGYMTVVLADGTLLWVVGRSNHALSVQGGMGVSRGDSLATVGIPITQRDAFRTHLAHGLSIVTVCETDPGRARRDADFIRRAGGVSVFVDPLYAGR